MLTEPATLGIAAAIYLLLQLASIYAAVHAVFYARSSQGATAWAIALVATPLIALPLYLVLGRNRFHGYVSARRMVDAEHADVIRQVNTFCDAFRSDLAGSRGTLHSLEQMARLPFTRGNRINLLIDGEAAFDAIFDAIDHDVPAPVITAALYARLYSRGNGDYTNRVLAALRNQFGGHAVERSSGGG